MMDARRKSAAALADAIKTTSGTSSSDAAIRAGASTPVADSIGSNIESVLFKMNNGEINRPQLREKLLNLKHNPILVDKLVSGMISPEQFARMSSEDMASPELQNEIKEIKRENLMQHVTTDGRMPNRTDALIASEAATNGTEIVDESGIEYENH
ncbi:transcription factor S-II, central domain-containing protein [Dipodascopsis uninucleata]